MTDELKARGEGSRTVSFLMPVSLYRETKAMSNSLDISVTKLIRIAIAAYLEEKRLQVQMAEELSFVDREARRATNSGKVEKP